MSSTAALIPAFRAAPAVISTFPSTATSIVERASSRSHGAAVCSPSADPDGFSWG